MDPEQYCDFHLNLGPDEGIDLVALMNTVSFSIRFQLHILLRF